MKIPDFVAKELDKISSEYGTPVSSLEKQYEEIYNTDWIQSDEQFDSDKDRHSYCIRRIWIDLAARGEEIIPVIPFGYSESRTTSKGFQQSKIYCYAKIKNEWEKIPLICQGDLSSLYEDMTLFTGYEIQVNNAGTILMATDNTEFRDGKTLPEDPSDFLTKELSIKKISIAQTVNDRSKVNKSGFTDELDFRLVQGIVVDTNNGERGDGSKWAFYRISDESSVRDRVTKDGKIIPRRFLVWCPISQQLFGEGSEIQVVGTIGGDKEPVMNACTILPIHVREI